MQKIVDPWSEFRSLVLLVHPGCTVDVISRLYLELINKYNEPHRHYHNLDHILYCLDKLKEFQGEEYDDIAVRFALWYHDGVYNIGDNQNEEKSCELAEKHLLQIVKPCSLIENVRTLILVTKHLQASQLFSFECKLMVDVDLSSFGDRPEFQHSCELIRKEYFSIDEKIYLTERIKILFNFITRPSIYLTNYFREKYELQAFENICFEIIKMKRRLFELNSHEESKTKFKSDFTTGREGISDPD